MPRPSTTKPQLLPLCTFAAMLSSWEPRLSFLPTAKPLAGGIEVVIVQEHLKEACKTPELYLQHLQCLRGQRSAKAHPASASRRVQRLAHDGADETVRAPAVIIGGGRVGEALAAMGSGDDLVVRRGEPFPGSAPSGPIYVCTRNDALKDVIDMTPAERREDLVFIQNGALLPFLEAELGGATKFTVLLVYFAVAKKGDPPLDGKTDTDPDGLSAVGASGKWAGAVATRLKKAGLACRVLEDQEFTKAYWEKNIWIAAYMLVGALSGSGTSVGDVESSHRSEVDDLIKELALAVEGANAGIKWDLDPLCEKLAAYARSVAHFPTAVKEFEWRNGAFYSLTTAAETAGLQDPCPLHTAGLKKIGALPAAA
eukprot:TRINITY_DN12743_c0_g1_i1.p1 TRINITY_DN12743_c0_g1~~TRINITY_DN12743_c0_g1_i1.p1  ORF type:complete len:369 (+),score=68.79 TRINITY_DN12743_c0_g1_i1:22-1128(+)